MINNHVFEYIRVDGDSLKDTNDNTRALWKEAEGRGFNEIVDITEKDGTEKSYLVDTNVYFNIFQAAKESEGKDPYGIPNVNFTLIDRNDDRWEEFRKQRLEHGFDESETWSLDSTISKFIAPRLKMFKECTQGYPSSFKSLQDWEKVLDKMILAFDYHNDESLGEEEGLSTKEVMEKRVKVIGEGLDLFAKYFCHLWW